MSTSPPPPDEARPTRIRHVIVLTATLMAALLYLDRFCVGFAVDYIREDLNLTQRQISWFISAFFWSYALAQVPSGWLSDRYGARIMLAVYILTWSFFTAMIGAVESLSMLLLARLATGLGQAGAYPTSASVVSKWVPFAARGTASSVIAFGGRVGGAVAPLLTAFLIVTFVPVSSSSLLTPESLRNPAELCDVLVPREPEQGEEPPEPNPAAERVAGLLPADVQKIKDRVAADWRPLDDRKVALYKQAEELQDGLQFGEAADKFAEADAISLDVSTADREALTDALNAIIERDDFYQPGAFDALKLDRTALGYIKRVNNGERLSQNEQQRFNRLLLEAVFQESLGKVYTAGWRPVMYVYGSAGLLVAALVWFFFRSRPEAHPWSNVAECALIERGRPADAPGPHGKPGRAPLGPLVKSGSMWCVCLMAVGTNVGWLFIYAWLPRYLLEVHDVPILKRGLMSSIPPAVGFLGMLAGGRFTDLMALRFGLKWGRRFPMMITRFTAALGYVLVILFASAPSGSVLSSPWAFIAGFSLVAFSTDMGTGAIWAFKQDVGGRYVGSVLGWGNMWGNLGAACSPMIYDYFLGEHPTLANWNNMFWVCIGAFVLSGVFALGVDASKPIAPPDEEE